MNDRARPIDRFQAALGKLLAVACPGWEPPDAVNDWALAHLTEHGVMVRRWRLGEALAADPLLAHERAVEVVAAIVLDQDVSLNHQLIEPLLVATGHERVLNLLLAHAESVDIVRQTGAAMAWYWASMPIGIPYPFLYVRTPRTSEADVEELPALLKHLTPRLQAACLRAFVNESGDRDMRRYLGIRISFDPDAYDTDVRPLLEQALRIIVLDPDLGALIRDRPATT